ncbi:GHKL domain-containing protein [Alkaliphilus sp. MSJ-5]|uniref:GHKL domain-containing protein n=1 Tax=Alkaliphilus flagellatus TaxID=2841507 RepID=A0ABS6FYQ2_9FIRM|nr:GHKL domain-containing protein [Alkaliphilus flagellatus]MBU5675011.1 GHKL domain-containing protein [Alkaliphilus flagellatus]
MIHEVRQKQHDFKNHLNVLYGLAQTEDDRQAKLEAKQYIESIIDRIKCTDQLLNIKDQVLSAIIYSKKALAEEKEICFEVEFQGEIPEYPMEKYELVELLGNLLDNAIEATESNNNEDNSKIVLALGKEEEFKLIEVRNNAGTLKGRDIDKIFERSFSTKKGKHRGYGLYNVKRIVNYYNGTIELSFDDSYIVFKILF